MREGGPNPGYYTLRTWEPLLPLRDPGELWVVGDGQRELGVLMEVVDCQMSQKEPLNSPPSSGPGGPFSSRRLTLLMGTLLYFPISTLSEGSQGSGRHWLLFLLTDP